ncbi:hypothetical protein GCM10010112_18080 [Actinoplanes lobatus]|uniref:Type II secretory pathway pseudopilin PulG n=1 Tax=Actinoplanes lobatus TaxID=113568 RepID=A0A7W7H9C0_9ACTN|nr:hypothetical protein [Actinoplanes lobatus]MBB4746232.1 type II secretory pathway pseudopilin PulG [Actinoplanes lobatus]GGN61211.1 hypothetical protein GCM10010112_18080 [Actinoplanes lobatus]GIE41440.1 hypothetical protein Alo02nite_43380 [Actinoplanes lobatus]
MKRRPDDEGAALVLVLIVISVVAVVLGALLTYADTSLRTTINLRAQASAVADADGAVQAAINNIRNSTSTADGKCFGSSNTLSLPSFDGTGSAAVSCSTDESSAVRIQCPSLSNCNRPGNAILTLGDIAGEDGLSIAQPNSATFRVHGSIYSKSTIDVASGSLSTSSGVYAEGACTGSIQSTPAKKCSSDAHKALGKDPDYTPTVSTAPDYQPMPACTSQNSVVEFSPGYYDDAVALSEMMSGSGKSKCRGSVWWFQPGTYYFDFHNTGTGTNRNPLLDSGDNVWTINDGKLVAGTPTGTLSSSTRIPGACVNPIDDARANGVQFIFGGDSRMVVRAGQAEICGGWNFSSGSTQPPVAVYGLTSGDDSTATKTPPVTSVVSKGDFTDATVAKLDTVDGSGATFKSPNKNASGSLTVEVAPKTAVPAGSILKSATVRVIHRHSTGSGNDPSTVVVTPAAGGRAQTVNLPGGAPSATNWQTEQASLPVDTTAGNLADSIYQYGFDGAQIKVTSTPGTKDDIESIDAIQLELSYVAPALRAESGCVTRGPYPGSSSSCAVIMTTNSPGSQLYVQGTTYTPKAALDISLNNLSEQVFRFGVISRSLHIKQTGSFAYLGPVIEVPDDAPGFAYAVYLTAYVCPAAPSCATTGTPRLRAKVAIVDAVPSAPVAGKRQIAILNWTPAG